MNLHLTLQKSLNSNVNLSFYSVNNGTVIQRQCQPWCYLCQILLIIPVSSSRVLQKSNPLDGATFTFFLHVLKGYTDVEQRFEFRAEYTGTPGWWRTYSFTLPAIQIQPVDNSNHTTVQETVIGEIKGRFVCCRLPITTVMYSNEKNMFILLSQI